MKTEEFLTTIFGAIIFIAVLFITLLAAAITHGLVLSILWSWFLVPLGAPAMNMVQAIGFALVFRYITFHHSNSKKDEEENPISKLIAMIFVYPLIVLLSGWFIHLFL